MLRAIALVEGTASHAMMPPTAPSLWSRYRPGTASALSGVIALLGAGSLTAQESPHVLSSLRADLVCHYDFEHPLADDRAQERDLGPSQTPLQLINGGAAMRVLDGAFPASVHALQTQQINPDQPGQDDWKAGVFNTGGTPSLSAFASARGITLMGWVKPTGVHPALASSTPDPTDRYNAVGLFGLLSGNSDGHSVRALVEILPVNGTLKLVALGRRLDGGSSLTLGATTPWEDLLPTGQWTHLTATFDFDAGTMALYRNGTPLAANYATSSDAWGVIGGAEPDLTSPSAPAGIKIGGSYPQNTAEQNAFTGRFDDLMFFKRTLTPSEIQAQYAALLATTEPIPALQITRTDTGELILSWTPPITGYGLETSPSLAPDSWHPVSTPPTSSNDSLLITIPTPADRAFFRLKKP